MVTPADHTSVVTGLEALGLKPLEARVLLGVLEREEVTNAALCSATGVSPAVLASAVEALVRRELIDRLTHRRPHVAFLHARASAAVDRLVEEAAQARTSEEGAVAAAVAVVTAGVRRREERGRPAAERHGTSPERRGKQSHLEVREERWARRAVASVSLQDCPARLLVTDAAWDLDLNELAYRQQPGSEVRCTSELLPQLSVLDGDRVVIHAGTPGGRALVWTWDTRHVRAAEELFGLWWDRAGPGIVKPYPPQQPEPEWDVEEWDPADL